MIKNLLSVLSLLISTILLAQEKPKLIVGIVVDQMRVDYLYRYYDDFEEGGFKRLLNDGFLFRNAHYNYVPTKTGPGHTSIYTGTTPSVHGIVGNDWYVPSIGRDINCAEDTTVSVVGGKSNGRVSPVNVKTTTITDELRLFYNFESKVVGVSLKDRGAAIPAGHNPTGAYWYDLKSGNMVTSTYYTDKLPDWVTKYNEQERYIKLLAQDWNLLRDPSVYNESIEDENAFEADLRKGFGTTFPYKLSKAKNDPYLLKYTPYTNTMIREVAMEALINEDMGDDQIPDFLTISFSATDDIGHRFGPRSMEVQDTYLRLDLEIKTILETLDKEVGEGSYVVFLSADHGATDVPSYMVKNKMPGGYHNKSYIKSMLNEKLSESFGKGKWALSVINEQVYLNRELAKEKDVDFGALKSQVVEILMSEDYVTQAFDADIVAKRMFTDPLLIKVQNGYNNKRSGDVLYVLSPSNLNDAYGRKGTDHRTLYAYDTNIPIIFYGSGVKAGSSVRPVKITDIAPTVSMLLNISLPSGTTGDPLEELFE